jgi:hypothetical protein
MKRNKLGRIVLISLINLTFLATLAFPNGLTPQEVTAPPGTLIKVRLSEEIGSHKSQVGDIVYSRLADPVVINGQTMFPVGTQVLGEVKDVHQAGRMWKDGQIEFVFNRILTDDGREYSIVANLEGASKYTQDSWKRRLYTIAIAAGAGILVSKIFGGSILKGLLLGSVAGAGYTLYTKNQDVVLPAGTTINLVLEQAVSTTYEFGPGAQPQTEEAVSEVQPAEQQPAYLEPAQLERPYQYFSDTIEVGPSVEAFLRSGGSHTGVFTGVTEEGKIIVDIQYGVLLIPVTDIRELVFNASSKTGAPAAVDTAYLNNGQKTSGTFKGFSDGKFVFASEYGEMRIPLDEVGRIVFAQ